MDNSRSKEGPDTPPGKEECDESGDTVVRRRPKPVHSLPPHVAEMVKQDGVVLKSRRQSQQDILKTASDLLEFTKTFIEARKDPAVHSQYDQMYIFLGALDRVLDFLNVDQEGVPEDVRAFILTALKELSAVEVGLVILYGALIIGFHMLDATPGKYQDERESIKKGVEFVKKSIKEILAHSMNSVKLLKQIIDIETGSNLSSCLSPLRKTQHVDQSSNEFPTVADPIVASADIAVTVDEAKILYLERLFKEEMREARVLMDNAEHCVEETRETIRKANSEIKGHLIAAGCIKAGLISTGLLGVIYMYKYSNISNKKTVAAVALLGISGFWLLSGVPKYAKLQSEFRTYANQVVELKSRLHMLKREIDSQESAFHQEAKNARARTNSETKMNTSADDAAASNTSKV